MKEGQRKMRQIKKGIAGFLAAALLLSGCGAAGDDSPADDKEQGYVFESGGVVVAVDEEAAGIIEALGDSYKYFETASCGFGELDKMYDYGSFEITTYQLEGVDYVSDIRLKDDMVETPEGVGLFMTKEDMVAAYGEDYIDEQGVYFYEKGNMRLKFIFEGDEIVSIEYVTRIYE